MASVPPIPGAGGVVFDSDGRVLVLRHQTGSWVFPKGHLDLGESALAAAMRETEEEAGVKAEALEPLIVETTRYRNSQGVARQISWFLLTTKDPTPVLREALFPEGAFLEPEEAARRLSFAEDRRLLGRMVRRYRRRFSSRGAAA